ncbi:MAG TPA: bifunctional DNA primase/helicase [Candidatus Omnitrophota bacterium]|nr:bifunctional DNA primase/helicase [Candidatus Omnitrophota bacterium]
MNELEFANAYLGEYKSHGSEIIPTYCPFCQGGDAHDKYTFALNAENHTYNCKRASCGEKGHFKELCDKYGVTIEQTYKPTQKPRKKVYKPSSTPIVDASSQALDYLAKRKITKETAALYGISSDGNGNIVIPFYRTKEAFEEKKPTFVKFRPARKIEKGERKMWREAETEPILFGLHLCDPRRKTLYITEGEFDCMTLRQLTLGALNIVSVPSGAEDFTWIDTCEDILEQYETIAVIGDADAPGQKMALDIDHKFPDKKVLLPDYSTYSGCKDVNEILFRYGEVAITKIFHSLKPKPVDGLINIGDIIPVDYTKIGRFLSNIKPLDKIIGGMYDGDISVWTGKRAEGKSAMINQLAVSAVNQGINVCMYSGEVPRDRLKYQLMLCAAGYLNVTEITDRRTGRDSYIVNPDIEPIIDAWLNEKLWIYDNEQIEIDERESIINLFTAAFRRYDCRLFIVDNLMTVNIEGRAGDMLQSQANFVIKLRKFAAKYNVHVFCVAHPRKGSIDDGDDVAGLGIIPNAACNLFAMRKCDDKKRAELDCDAILTVMKNRAYGDLGEIKLKYDTRSHRFFAPYAESETLSWEKNAGGTANEA